MTSDFTRASSSSSDWLGFDNGTRALPDFVAGLDQLPTYSEARRDPVAAAKLDQASKSFQTPMAPVYGNSGLPARLNMSYADIFDMGNVPVGVVASMQYAQNFDGYRNGVFALWQLTGKASEKDRLDSQMVLNDNRGTQTAFWGGMFNMNFKVAPNHQLGVNFMHNQRAENTGRFLFGELPRDLPSDFVFETRTQRFIERGNTTVQLVGEHMFQGLNQTTFEWRGSYNASYQDEPDIRFFSNEYKDEEEGRSYAIDAANYDLPAHFYREMNEDLFWFDGAFKVPFQSWTGTQGNFKFGGAANIKNRNFTESRYEYVRRSAGEQYNGDPDAFFGNANVGIVDSSSSGRALWGNTISDVSELRGRYTGEQNIWAGFGMVELPVSSKLRVITGARLEYTDLTVNSADQTAETGRVDTLAILPSVSMIYSIQDNMNLRMSYGRTLARPTFRELAPFSSFDFVNGFILNGNPDLKQTDINNYDIRWEWFTRPTDILAVSGFVKQFYNPIVLAIVTNNGQTQYQNVDFALVYGAELEARSTLDFISESMRDFYLGGNFTYTFSEVNIPDQEMLVIRELFGDDARTTRPLQGQSPYLLNLQLGYVNYETGTDANVSFNVFGDRLATIGFQGTPDVYEASRARLDIVVTQRLIGDLSMKVQALNMLNPAVRQYQSYNGNEFDVVKYLNGQTFTIGFNYSL